MSPCEEPPAVPDELVEGESSEALEPVAVVEK
jgi:hypothetical protein